MSEPAASDPASHSSPDVPCPDAGSTRSPHLVRCRTCGHWLHADEDELLASLEKPIICWTCAERR